MNRRFLELGFIHSQFKPLLRRKYYQSFARQLAAFKGRSIKSSSRDTLVRTKSRLRRIV
jgi:hypothetical protein